MDWKVVYKDEEFSVREFEGKYYIYLLGEHVKTEKSIEKTYLYMLDYWNKYRFYNRKEYTWLEAYKKYLEGYSLERVAEMFDVDKTTILRNFRKFQFDKRNTKRHIQW